MLVTANIYYIDISRKKYLFYNYKYFIIINIDNHIFLNIYEISFMLD